jgi:hypothetical protein
MLEATKRLDGANYVLWGGSLVLSRASPGQERLI